MIMSEWFVSKSGKTHGPFSASQLKQLAAETKIGPETEVRLGTDGAWVTAKTVKGLFAAQAATTAAVVPTAAPPVAVATAAQAAALNSSAVGEEELLKVYPSYLRNDPIGFCFLILLGAAGLVFDCSAIGSCLQITILITLRSWLASAYYYSACSDLCWRGCAIGRFRSSSRIAGRRCVTACSRSSRKRFGTVTCECWS